MKDLLFTNEKLFDILKLKIMSNLMGIIDLKGSMNMSVLKVTKDNFNEVKNSDKTVLLDFYADWCGPCKMVGPIIDEIAKENPDILVGKINVDEQPELASSFSVMSIPTLVVMRNGEVVNKSMGARPKAAILSMID